ncbi:MAG: response regulator [Cytophaga sp.]|nr:response regulator [Undibacterium sp.]
MENSNVMTFSDKKLKVMIIDDDEFQIDFVVDQLGELGIYQVVSASSGKSALATFDKAQPKPDLLICDIQMPDIDGFAIMKAMDERSYTGGVILMSGQGARVLYSASLVAQLARQNFLGTVEKPVQKESLAKAIEKMYS